MVSVAQHRQWDSLQVRGSVEFRREAWLEAGARGLEVQGYQPTELDRQTLADRREVWDRAHSGTPEVEARWASDKGERADKFDYDKGISGRLIEVGQAPYRNRTDAEATTYVALELDNGRQHQVWGVGLEKATADSNAKPGDRVHVRRDGVERVTKEIRVIDATSGHAHIEQRQMPRNRWQVTAEKFRAADRQTAAREPDLVTAQSQMVIIEKAWSARFPRIYARVTASWKRRGNGSHTILGKDTHSAEQPSWNQLRTVIDRKAIKVMLCKPGTASA